MLGMLAAGLAVVLSAGLAAALLRPPSLLSFLLAVYVLGFAEVVALLLALSLADALRPTALAVGLSCALAAAGAAWLWAGRPPPPGVRPGLRTARELVGDPLLALLAAAVAAAFAYSAALTLLTPANDGDALVYHLARALFWRQEGHIGYVPDAVDLRLDVNPPHAELGQLFTILVSGTDRFVGLPQLGALAVSCLALAGLARRAALTSAAAAFGALLFATYPIVQIQASTALNDLVVCACLAVAAYFLLDERGAGLWLAGLATALAAGTKFTAAYGIPLLVVIALVGRAERRLSAVVAVGAGTALGSYWYGLNLWRRGSLDGDLASWADQVPEHSLPEIATTLHLLSLQLVDLSGTGAADVWLYAVVATLPLAWVLARGERLGERRALLAAVPLAALLPVASGWLSEGAERLHELTWRALGRADIAAAAPDGLEPGSGADAMVSWYGPAGILVAVGGLALAIVDVARRRIPTLHALFAAAPALAIVALALTVVWDPYRGRFAMFMFLLATVAWARTYETRRWLALASAIVGCTAMAVSLVNLTAKPSGVRIVRDGGPSLARTDSVWTLPRVEVQGILRPGDPEIEALRFVATHVPGDAPVAVAPRPNDFLSPYFGAGLDRTVRLVEDGGRVPADAEWLVVAPEVFPERCAEDWARVFEAQNWVVERRVGSTC